MSVFLGFVLGFGFQVVAIEKFKPIFAADQKVLTLKSMQYETDQFRTYAKWQAQEELLKSARAREELMRKEYSRAQDLFDRGLSSQTQLDRARMDYERAVITVSSVADAAQKLQLETRLFSRRIQEEGNPGIDLRAGAIKEIVESLQLEKRYIQRTLQSARADEGFYQRRFETGRKLLENGTITQTELDRRKLDWEGAKNRVTEFEVQLEAIEVSITGAKKSEDRLSIGDGSRS